MLANESDFELHFSLNCFSSQFKSIFQEKEDFRNLLYFTVLHRPANFKTIMTQYRNVETIKIRKFQPCSLGYSQCL